MSFTLIPSVDRPFGIYLYPYVEKLFAFVSNGKFIMSEFEFVAGETFMSTLPEVIPAIALYYLVVFGGRAVLNAFNVRPFVLNGLFQLHNLFLTTLSFILFVSIVEQLIPQLVRHGLFFAICDERAWTRELIVLYYMNYLTKFLEFVDTIFLVLKQKKLTFLHTYHHGATALLCFTQLVGTTPISWVPISLNLFVHVVMYWYYFLAARGIRVWWKEWVTRFQIIQFIIDLTFIYFAVYIKVMSNIRPELAGGLTCSGTPTATISGCAIISSYLFLFIAFYIEVYKKKSKKSKVVQRVRGGVAAKVNEYVYLDKKTLQENYDSTTGSPMPTQRKRFTKKAD
ncbi:fatty acid elongase [Martiniozyma asiatica (nom. inval.)]|nr:fatty acid elongase [Martiniozyma asiatica]